MIGTWNLDVMLKSGSRHIERDLNQILADHGYQSETAGDNYINTGVNWGYTGAQLSGSMDPATFIAICAVLLLIIFTGYVGSTVVSIAMSTIANTLALSTVLMVGFAISMVFMIPGFATKALRK